MVRSWPSVLIGFLIPIVLIVGGILILGPLHVVVGDFPLVFIWIFACMPLTWLCLWISWNFFDRKYYVNEERRK
jgi:hypothetical protein